METHEAGCELCYEITSRSAKASTPEAELIHAFALFYTSTDITHHSEATITALSRAAHFTYDLAQPTPRGKTSSCSRFEVLFIFAMIFA